MNSKKEYEAKIRKLNRKVEKMGKKISSLQSANKKLRAEHKYNRKRIKTLIASRDSWKTKHKEKQSKIKSLNEQLERAKKAKYHHFPLWLNTLAVLLRIKCGCSYESIVKILKLLNMYLHFNLTKIPCANTIQNWVSKVGLYQLENATIDFADTEVSIILDESIRLGQEKLLLVLAVPFAKQSEEALSFTDVKVVYMKGSKSWKGEAIADEIQNKLIDEGLKVVNVLSDQGNNLLNATKLLQLDHLPDIGHAIAICLKQTFEKDPDYQVFNKLLASYSSKGVNQDLSYLIPPKLGSKARFMNQSRVIHWAELMLTNWAKLSKTEKAFFAQLTEHKEIIQTLNTCMAIAQTIGLVLKTEGLSNQTLEKIEQKIKEIDTEKDLVNTFLTKIKGYLGQYKQFLAKYPPTSCVHVSSDIIESLFGKYKNKASNYALTGLTKLNLELSLYCMEEKEIIRQTQLALEGISMTRLGHWVIEYSPDNQLVRRLEFRKKVA